MNERVERLLELLVVEQQKTNDLLDNLIKVQSQLIEALAEDGALEPVEPAAYLSGKPVL